jgi:hypothetical protein
MEIVTLKEELKNLEDFRRGQGREHELDIVLMCTIMGTMSGYLGYRAIGDFCKRYEKELKKYLKPKKDKLPSYPTVRRVVQGVNEKKFMSVFKIWMIKYMKKTQNKWVAIDGKAINGLNVNEDVTKMAHLVSFFKSDSKEVLLARKTATKSNEIPLVQQMISEFDLDGFIFTLDAMHTQKETLKKNKA